MMAEPTERDIVYTFRSADMNLVATLLCNDAIFLQQTEAQPLPDSLRGSGKRPRCYFTVASSDNQMLLDLIKRHREDPEGLAIPTKRYDQVRRNIVVPAMKNAQKSLLETSKG